MKRKKEYMRCGHCGRSIERKYWKGNELYCKGCHIFICKKCTVLIGRCPRCLGHPNICTIWLRDYLSLLFLTIEVLMALGIVFSGIHIKGVVLLLISIQVITIPLWLPIIILHLITIKRRKKHIEHLKTLPEGIIPKKERRTSDRLEYETEKNRKRLTDHILRKKRMDPQKYGYRGRWNGIPLSKKEFIIFRRKNSSFNFISSFVLILLGIAFVIPTHLAFNDLACSLIVFTPATAGGLILLIEILKFFDDMGSGPRRISAPSEVESVEKATAEIERFLREMGLEHTMKTIPRMKMMTHDLYENHYFIEGNIQIGIYYGHGKQYGKVESFIFRFDYSDMDHVQKVFRSYDDFLARKKLISVWDVDIDKTLSLNK